MKIGFWKKETGNMLSHSAGLTPEQVRNIQALVPGQRLILWENIKRKESDPDFTLDIMRPKEPMRSEPKQ